MTYELEGLKSVDSPESERGIATFLGRDVVSDAGKVPALRRSA